MELLSTKTFTAKMNDVFIDHNMIDHVKRYHVKYIKRKVLRLFIFCYLYERARGENMNEAYLKSDKTSKGDETYTPFYGVEPIIKYLPKDKIIWCPFDEDWSAFPRRLREEGFTVVNSHINNGQDFFNYLPPFDIIISNPPYSIKDKVIKRCYELGKPFALLMPIPTIQGERRFKIWGNDIQLLVFDKRINFHTRGNLKTTSDACHFGSGYFCRNILPEKLIVEELDRFSRPLVEE